MLRTHCEVPFLYFSGSPVVLRDSAATAGELQTTPFGV